MKSSTKTFFWIFAGIGLFMFALISYSDYLITSNPNYKELTSAEKEERKQKDDAALNAQLLVKRKLKSPSTAKFPPTSTAKITKSATGTWIVSSYVDSQNGFGAMVRNDWVAEIKYLPNNQIELVNIHFQE